MLDNFWGRGLIFESRSALTYTFNSLTALGTRPPPWKRFKFIYYIYMLLMFLIIGVITPLTFNLSYIFNRSQMKTTQFLTSLQASINILGIPAKIITVNLSMGRFRKSEVYMNILDKRCTRADMESKLRQAVIMGSRFVIFFGCIYGIYGFMTFVTSIALGQPPFSLYVPQLQWKISSRNFWLQVSWEIFIFLLVLYRQVIDDSYVVIYIYIIRTHMQLLVGRVLALGTDPLKSQQDNYDELVQCVVDHQRLLELLHTVSPVISTTIFVQFLVTASILGVTMINVFIFADTATRIASFTYFFTVFAQTSPCCYHATLMMYDSEQLPLALFHCNWMDQNIKFRKMLIFFMQNAQKSMTLMAWKLFPINLSTNLSIGKFSFSLYTLIKNMDFGKFWKN